MSLSRHAATHLVLPPRMWARLNALALLAICAQAGAITFTVKTAADTVSGNATAGSLRDGIIAVNASSDAGNTIQFSSGLPGYAHFVLGSPLPPLFNNLTIDGTGVYPSIDGQNTYRIISIGVDTAAPAWARVAPCSSTARPM